MDIKRYTHRDYGFSLIGEKRRVYNLEVKIPEADTDKMDSVHLNERNGDRLRWGEKTSDTGIQRVRDQAETTKDTLKKDLNTKFTGSDFLDSLEKIIDSGFTKIGTRFDTLLKSDDLNMQKELSDLKQAYADDIAEYAASIVSFTEAKNVKIGEFEQRISDFSKEIDASKTQARDIYEYNPSRIQDYLLTSGMIPVDINLKRTDEGEFMEAMDTRIRGLFFRIGATQEERQEYSTFFVNQDEHLELNVTASMNEMLISDPAAQEYINKQLTEGENRLQTIEQLATLILRESDGRTESISLEKFKGLAQDFLKAKVKYHQVMYYLKQQKPEIEDPRTQTSGAPSSAPDTSPAAQEAPETVEITPKNATERIKKISDLLKRHENSRSITLQDIGDIRSEFEALQGMYQDDKMTLKEDFDIKDIDVTALRTSLESFLKKFKNNDEKEKTALVTALPTYFPSLRAGGQNNGYLESISKILSERYVYPIESGGYNFTNTEFKKVFQKQMEDLGITFKDGKIDKIDADKLGQAQTMTETVMDMVKTGKRGNWSAEDFMAILIALGSGEWDKIQDIFQEKKIKGLKGLYDFEVTDNTVTATVKTGKTADTADTDLLDRYFGDDATPAQQKFFAKVFLSGKKDVPTTALEKATRDDSSNTLIFTFAKETAKEEATSVDALKTTKKDAKTAFEALSGMNEATHLISVDGKDIPLWTFTESTDFQDKEEGRPNKHSTSFSRPDGIKDDDFHIKDEDIYLRVAKDTSKSSSTWIKAGEIESVKDDQGGKTGEKIKWSIEAGTTQEIGDVKGV